MAALVARKSQAVALCQTHPPLPAHFDMDCLRAPRKGPLPPAA